MEQKRDKLFDKYYNIWVDILDEKIVNDSVMPWIYQLDDVSEIHNPDMWQKAMPLLGITTEKETIAKDIEMSKNDPAQQAELMAKTFNLPVNNYLAYFSNEECKVGLISLIRVCLSEMRAECSLCAWC